MPHVVIEGEVSLQTLFDAFEPIEVRSGRDILKATEMYLGRAGHSAFVECIAVEGRARTFLIVLDRKPTGLTIRLYPPTDPEKTDGVRRLLGLVAARVIRRFPRCTYGATNIEGYLVREDS